MRYPRLLLFSAALVLAGCADDEPTPPAGGGPGGDLLPEPAVRVHPRLTLQAPARGAFLADGPLSPQGRTERGSALLTRLTVGTEEATLDPSGAFSHTLDTEPGVNIVPLRLEAEDGGRAVEALSVFAGPVHEPGVTLEGALLVHVGPELLDDDDEDLDDVARLLELMFVSQDFQEGLKGTPVSDDLTLETFELEAASVDLSPGAGCLDGAIRLGNAADPGDPGVHIRLDSETYLLGALGTWVDIRADQADIEAAFCPALVEETGAIVTTVETPQVTLREFHMSTENFPNLADRPAYHDPLQGLVEVMLTSQLQESLGGFVDQFLGSFAIERTIGEERPVTVRFTLANLWVRPEGVELNLDGSFSVAVGLANPPQGAGSLRTDDEPPAVSLSSRPLAIAMSDDALNQLLFTTWWGGLASPMDLSEALGGADLSALPEVFSPLTDVVVDLGLPPTVMAPSDPEKYPYDLAAGEVAVRLLVGADRRFAMRLHVRAGAGVGIGDDGLVAIQLDNRARRITVTAGVSEVPEGLDPGDVAALIRMMTPSLLGTVKTAMPGFPIPSIDLSTFGGLTAFEGQALALDNAAARRLGEGGGYLVVEGDVTLVDVPPPTTP